MKTNLSVRMFKLSALLALAIVLAQPVFATPMLNQLVITENSPTDLSATYNGVPLTVTPLFPGVADAWFFSPPSGVIVDFRNIPPLETVHLLGFVEPDDPALANLVFVDDDGRVHVSSDVPFAPLLNDFGDSFKLVSDGTIVGPLGFDRNNRIPVELTLHDNAGSSESVPDNSSTFTLLGAASTALFCARQRAAVRAT
jgi:hypothetical protein